ncbi:uncharacterized protein A4U43_C07F12290 [Asparagus officinalis]|uniref:Pentatricopeptide repeat-containing protein n=1 Tax=Asparagus officinalis TaxID=4686 RepID=A0A5P1EBC8_ASPOF|nr:uncharacterized protein A4U43_C07F12290 [Asparagus officinalis]
MIPSFHSMISPGDLPGCYPTNYTLGSVLSACSSLPEIDFGEQIHGYLVKYGLELDTSIGNSLCGLYSKCGRLKLAAKAFQRIEDKNVISWTTIVSACGDNGNAELGLRMFLQICWWRMCSQMSSL